MPHFVIEYSANLEGRVDFKALCSEILAVMLQSGLFERGAVRVRARQVSDYAIADELPENAFIDMALRIGVGRSAEEKSSLGDVIFKCVSERLADLFLTPYFALSFEIREIDPKLSWKKNAIHPRLRADGS
jgi:5-carboxymethyl-2-hydroxymuconate isomerase